MAEDEQEYDFSSIERRWQEFWECEKTFRAEDGSDKPKYYALDMFPYPSGAGLHIGHPEGYVASWCSSQVCISPISPLYLPCISPISPLHLREPGPAVRLRPMAGRDVRF